MKIFIINNIDKFFNNTILKGLFLIFSLVYTYFIFCYFVSKYFIFLSFFFNYFIFENNFYSNFFLFLPFFHEYLDLIILNFLIKNFSYFFYLLNLNFFILVIFLSFSILVLYLLNCFFIIFIIFILCLIFKKIFNIKLNEIDFFFSNFAIIENEQMWINFPIFNFDKCFFLNLKNKSDLVHFKNSDIFCFVILMKTFLSLKYIRKDKIFKEFTPFLFQKFSYTNLKITTELDIPFNLNYLSENLPKNLKIFFLNRLNINLKEKSKYLNYQKLKIKKKTFENLKNKKIDNFENRFLKTFKNNNKDPFKLKIQQQKEKEEEGEQLSQIDIIRQNSKIIKFLWSSLFLKIRYINNFFIFLFFKFCFKIFMILGIKSYVFPNIFFLSVENFFEIFVNNKTKSVNFFSKMKKIYIFDKNIKIFALYRMLHYFFFLISSDKSFFISFKRQQDLFLIKEKYGPFIFEDLMKMTDHKPAKIIRLKTSNDDLIEFDKIPLILRNDILNAKKDFLKAEEFISLEMGDLELINSKYFKSFKNDLLILYVYFLKLKNKEIFKKK
jgi:hypothetical protein